MKMFNHKAVVGILLTMAPYWPQAVMSGELITGDLLSNFKNTSGWSVAESVTAVAGETRVQTVEYAGQGAPILSNGPRKNKAEYITTLQAFGDVTVHLEFMVPAGSNAGVYLMGRYEIQILDSYGVTNLSFSDLGAVYQRWDKKITGKNKGFEGVPPLVNAAKAPGEWQTMDIDFIAPRFDAEGNKTANAKFASVHVNGQLVQENEDVTGPTRAHRLEGEVATAPILIQGNHGPVAIRSLVVTPRKSDAVAAASWVDLFNGKDLTGWTAYKGKKGDENSLSLDQVFTVNNGAIHTYAGAKHGSEQFSANLVHAGTFSNFHLQLEYRWRTNKFSPRAGKDRDAGILFHIHSNPEQVWPPSIEMRFGDGQLGSKYVTGDGFILLNSRADVPTKEGAYHVAGNRELRGELEANGRNGKAAVATYAEKARGEWNRAEVIVRGSEKAEYYLNGQLVNELYNLKYKDAEGRWKPFESGSISVQAEWAELEYRAIRIKEL